ncbi:hypothetical protein ACHHYP_20164 [Achlya hypogyna]|uniref:F-box domain-containing protein n=1 Tax=Achlya hypogyna TaxID=1202772 RepID=A0A1V9Z1I9_ACHHY|nr:hypothetical protein ACHHYP_20164 [Achlya hypogyna]
MLAALPRDVTFLILAAAGPADAYSVACTSRALHGHVVAYAQKQECLEFHSCTRADAGRVIFFLRHATSLRHLSLRASHRLVSDAFLAAVGPRLCALNSLSLAYCVDVTTVASLAGCTSLVELDLSGCTNLRKLEVVLPALRVLNCAWCRRLQANDAAWPKLAVTDLTLQGWDLPDADLVRLLQSLRHIKRLSLVNVPLSSAGLDAMFTATTSLNHVELSKKSANVWADGTWDLATLHGWVLRRPTLRVVLV